MIEELVPPMSSGGLASPPIVERLTTDDANIDQKADRRADDGFLEFLEQLHTPGAESSPDERSLRLRLPSFMMDELRWVADQESCDVAEIVVNAVDAFLADHWVRNQDI